MHEEAFAFVEDAARRLARCSDVVEIGGRQFNYHRAVRDLFPHATGYTSVDILDGAGVDVVADAASWRPAWTPDVIVCCEVLEHADDPAAIVRNAAEMLAPGGALIVTCATDDREPHSAEDGGVVRRGEHYANVEPAALLEWLTVLRLRRFEVHADRGDLYALAVKGE